MLLFLDTENTTWSKGSAYDQRNFNVAVAFARDAGEVVVNDAKSVELEQALREADTLVCFNAKYDISWLRRLGLPVPSRTYCCQLAAFILGRQETPYPSLQGVSESYGFGAKLDVVKTEYWDKGINTDQVPKDILTQYVIQDVELTRKIYYRQQELTKPHQKTLISLSMQDLLVLQEIEWNGLTYDKKLAETLAKEAHEEIETIQATLNLSHSVPSFNWGSNDHLSALLFGGTIIETIRIPNGVFKSGQRVDEQRYRVEEREHKLRRLYKPVRKTEAGKWSTDEDTLRKLGSGGLIEGLLRSKELSKLVSTYYDGIPRIGIEQCFREGYVHGSFNQVVTRTGRLSCSRPNLQNLAGPALAIFRSRYE